MSIWKEKEDRKGFMDAVETAIDIHAKGKEGNSNFSLLDAFNKHIGKTLGDADVLEKENCGESGKNYRELAKTGEIFTAALVSSDAEGNYMFEDGDYKVILKSSTMDSYGLVASGPSKATLLGDTEIRFKVIEVSEEKNADGKYEVFVDLVDKRKFINHKQEAKARLTQEIITRLNKKERPIVWGRITKVQSKAILVDLCEVGIMGRLGVTNWQAAYTHSFEGLVHEGEYYQFEITEMKDPQPGQEPLFYLSRRKLAADLWTINKLDELKPGQEIVVTCKDVPEGKTYWWGVSERMPGIFVTGDYTNKFMANVTVFPGISYICKVKSVEKIKYRDEQSCRVSVKPVMTCKSDVVAAARLRRMNGVGGKNMKIEE